MSRIIVKNLPNNVDANKLREKFSEQGYVTDLQLKYTPQGKFRKFGFVGYETPDQAEAAVQHFNKTYFGTSRLQVELCNELGDEKKPKAWSKYSIESSAFKKSHEDGEEATEKSKNKDEIPLKKKNKNKKGKNKIPIHDEEVIEQMKKHKDDPGFIEFMELHGKADKVLHVQEIEDEEESEDNDSENQKQNTATAHSAISDLEYLKTKMKGDNSESVASKIIKDEQPSKPAKEYFTIKISNLPYKVTKKDIRRLLNPVSPASVRLPPKIKGIAYVGFETEKEKRRALIKNKTFLNGRQLSIVEYKNKEDTSTQNRWKEQEDALKHEENIAESGRIFIRNLSYSVTEDEVQNIFSKYGPIAEIILPIDRVSRQVKGYGIITYILPEHAVAAYSELDGTILQGRMLHLLPAKAKEHDEEDESKEEGTNFKTKKMKKLKEKAGSSHNWNTLFMDLNAVAEVVAKKYNVSKEEVLTGKDAAIRLALGETQLVSETKKFLEENGVMLDAFNQEVKKRSKTVLLAKNLPANTDVSEIRDLFAKYGELGRVLLPPGGITGLVEFLEPSEARVAFRNLAYSKFKYLPLYLEWAPDNSLSTKEVSTKDTDQEQVTGENKVNVDKDGKQQEEEVEEDDDREIIDNNATLFVKNLNFETTEDDLKEHFKSCGKIASVIIARKKDTKVPGALLSMGYGFLHFYSLTSLNEALKRLQGSELKGHTLELKRSNRTLPNEIISTRKKTNVEKQIGTKIMVRNIPFQATQKEITDLFKIFGELKFVRLPKKLVGTGSHRGFAFVEFVSKSDAKRAMKSLCQSTHLLGRRLVLEWAEQDDDPSLLRKRTAKNFHEGSMKKSKIEISEEKEDDIDLEDMEF